MKSTKFRNIKLKRLSKDALQCAVCHANFDVWVGNQRLNENREENLRKHFLSYCPTCAKTDEKNKL
ncbi:MAG: hypothetical protein NT026_02405 [Candidatus Staskawiczbacteria bacterium]|nr:hypothetical protein [Candidatus Staskawiczbacteria bacterium]